MRGQATHELVSDLHLTWGYIAYFEGSVRSPTYGFNANHRFFLRFRWDFGTP